MGKNNPLRRQKSTEQAPNKKSKAPVAPKKDPFSMEKPKKKGPQAG